MSATNEHYFLERKRRVFAELVKPAKVENGKSWLSIERSSKDLLLTFRSKGLVVSINGGGDSLKAKHPHTEEAAALAKAVVERGGLIMTGGRNVGVMEASTNAADGKSMGIIFPELRAEQTKKGSIAVVNAPTPRIELLATCAPFIVIFRGGLGSLMVLMRAIVHLENRQYHADQPPQIVFVSNYWVALLTAMMNMGSLPKAFLSNLHFFERAEQVLDSMPPYS